MWLGGAFKTISCFENRIDVWDGAVPFVHGSPVSMPNLFTVQAPRDARPDAAANQAAHDVLTSRYPAPKSGLDQLLATELSAIPNSQRKRDGIRVGATVAKLLNNAVMAAQADLVDVVHELRQVVCVKG